MVLLAVARPGLALLCAAATLAALAAPAAAFAFHGPDGPAAAHALGANRWDADPRAERGLGGGLTFSVDAGFCAALQAASSEGACPDFIAAVHAGFRAWSDRHAGIRFVDVSQDLPARLDDEGGHRAHGAEIDVFARATDEPGTLQARTRNMLQPAAIARLANGDAAEFPVIFSADIHVVADARCGTDSHISCWTPRLLREAIMHEVGHALGLAHPFESRNLALPASAACDRPYLVVRDTLDVPGSVMNYKGVAPFEPNPSRDDIAGLHVLYPNCQEARGAFAPATLGTQAYRVQGTLPPTLLWSSAGAALALAAVATTVALRLRARRHARLRAQAQAQGPRPGAT